MFVLAGLLAAGAAGAAIIVVNDSSDTLHSLGCAAFGTGTCTLRDAITFANTNAGPDEIDFAIFGAGVHTITLNSDLPTVAGDLTINGYTQAGSSPNTNGPGLGDNAVLLIEINGNGKGCLFLEGRASTVRGLVINRCGGSGILVSGYYQEVNSPNLISGNFIGIDAAGAGALPNETGVLISPSDELDIVIGGTTPGARNVISGNRETGIVFSSPVAGLFILGNFIGTDVTGTKAVPNGGSGIEKPDPLLNRVEIGDNVVSGNAGKGVALEEANANIRGNFIGTDVSGTLPLGNGSTGVWLHDIAGNVHSQISGNTVAFNGISDPIGGGIVNTSDTHFQYFTDPTILGNSIFDNTSDGSVPDRGLGIDLVSHFGGDRYGPTSNEPCNFTGQGNPPQNFPVLTAALVNGSSITLRGVLDSRRTRAFRIEFFANPTCDPSGYGEGKTFLGWTTVTTNDSCSVPFDVILPVAVPVGQYVTATATDASTSEFSPCIQVHAAGSLTVVDRLVTLLSITTESSMTDVPGGPAGTMTIRATFKNTSSTPINAPFFVVSQLSGGNLLLNADGGAGGVGARLTPGVGSDGMLTPGETFTAEFDVGLQAWAAFTFLVDLWGEPGP